MDRSLFTRLYQNIAQNVDNIGSVYAMTRQYRMHPNICHFPNQYFYENRLQSDGQTLESFPLRPYSVFNLNCLQSNRDIIHFYNVEEAQFIVSMLKVMIKHANPIEFSYGIITPYAKQRTEIQNLLGYEIRSQHIKMRHEQKHFFHLFRIFFYSIVNQKRWPTLISR